MSQVNERIENRPIADWDELQAVVERFEDAWRRGERPSIDDYLTSGNLKRRDLLVELVHQDLEYRLKGGEPARVERYVERYPELGADPGTVLGLIAAEYELRRRCEATLAIEEYFQRFPQYRDEILSHFKIDPKVSCSPANRLRLGRFQLLECVGRGAFGEVYRARDPELNRTVAVKVPRVGQGRIRDEARWAARLRHPGIVTVLDVGREGDQWYIVSNFIDGMTLATRVEQVRFLHTEAALLVAKVADALHYAHLQGVVHRDVKPGNILLDQREQPYITDFGLALSEDELKIAWGKQAGTPAYMAPEQVRGEGHRIDPRTDVYSLGVVLYELLCGRRPFAAATTKALFEQVRHREPRPPRTIDDSIPRELERICLKAMSKRVGDRFTTAKDMADELRLAVTTLAVVPRSAAGATFGPVMKDAETPPGTPTGVGDATESDSAERTIPVVPKGLRSFGTEDAEFFLELLPGPRDRDGLPESIRFWKARIESSETRDTFAVGLIYGPSGCGKTSFVKAGLLPRLAKTILAVYVEATREDTEARLGRALRRVCPGLNGYASLGDMIAQLRRGELLAADQKVLIVLDQFEQWLHACGHQLHTRELVAALRQADGEHVQCLLMVRDDFWAATNRLFQNLELGMVEDRNVRLVDLFDQQHARHVLELFGSAYGQLPTKRGELTADQESFLNRAVTDLSQDGLVVPVRLSLFADLMKGRPWTASSLAQVGGTTGVGIKFLDETFTGRTAVPEHRAIAKPARALLQSLLPEHGADIKGRMQSRRELASACGLSEDSFRFRRILEVLDRELRIITPTEVDQADTSETRPGANVSPEGYYQLTHDYLVPPLREWLTQEQRKSRRGRAALRLAERSGLWNNRPEARHLPTFWECVNIQCLTVRKDWTAVERKMMRTATRVHAVRGGIAAILLAAVTLAGSMIHSRVADYLHKSKADALIATLMVADIGEVRGIIGELNAYRPWANATLRQDAQRPSPSKERLHARLALLPVDPSQVEGLIEDLLNLNSTPQELLVIRDALGSHQEKEHVTARLWHQLEDSNADQRSRFRAACALAAIDSDDPRWTPSGPAIVARLVAENPIFLGHWIEALRPVAPALLQPLAKVFRRTEKPAERSIATSILADYAGRPEDLADLILDADAQEYAVLWPALKRHHERAIELMKQELDKTPSPDWNDSPVCPTWLGPDRELVNQIEGAEGIFAERFALCQTMALDQFVAVAEGLRGSGYRPIRFRAYSRADRVHVAAVWTRDGLDWRMAHGIPADQVHERDAEMRQRSYWPVDLSCYLEPAGTAEYYAALWGAKRQGVVDARICVGLCDAECLQAWRHRAVPLGNEYVPETHQMIVGTDGELRSSSIWRKPQKWPGWGASVNSPESSFSARRVSTDIQMDISVHEAVPELGKQVRSYSIVWQAPETLRESRESYGLDSHQHLEQCRAFMAQGYRPAAISVASLGAENPLVTASIWHRPLHSVDAKDALARRKAHAAVTAFRLGQSEQLWPLLRHTEDPCARTYLIHQLCSFGVDPESLVDRLNTERDVSVRRALVLCLGEFADQLAASVREKLTARLLVAYRNDPDAGFHSAAEWLLRQLGERDQLHSIDEQLHSQGPIENVGWYINREGQTLAVIRGPVDFEMGTTPDKKFDLEGSNEGLLRRRIPRSFAIATKEVTVAQFKRFWQTIHPGTPIEDDTYSPDTDGPIIRITWFEAAQYCRWLSEQEGIEQDQMCYPEIDKIRVGIQFESSYLSRTGYRLPTEAEWEYACRAGATTSRPYGSSPATLGKYAWCQANSQDRAHPVGLLKPNDFGLFDVLGNAWEWCEDRQREGDWYDRLKVIEDREDPTAELASDHRILRGGAFDSPRPLNFRCDHRFHALPTDRTHMAGFRVARTYRAPVLTARSDSEVTPVSSNANREINAPNLTWIQPLFQDFKPQNPAGHQLVLGKP